MTVSRVVAYRFLKEDGSLAKVGLRFGVSPRAIWTASQELPPIKGRAMSSLKPGESLLIPLPEPQDDPNEQYDWRAGIIAVQTTVNAFADNVNQGEASRAIPITGADLWFNIKNADFRDQKIRAGQPDDPASALLQPNDRIQIPHRKAGAASISAAPTPKGPPPGGVNPRSPAQNVATAVTAPRWVQVVEDATEDLIAKTSEYANLASPGLHLRVECAKDAVILDALRQFADLLASQADPSNATMAQLKAKAKSAGEVAGRTMLINPAKIILHWEETDKNKAAKALFAEINNPDVLAALKEGQKAPNFNVTNAWSDAARAAAELLLDSSQSNEIGQEIDNTVAFAANNQLTDPKSTFDVIAAIGAVASAIVGNTPSPSNLVIGLASMRSIQNLPNLVNNPAACGALADQLLKIILRLPQADGTALSSADIATIRTAVTEGDLPTLQDWNSKLIGKYATFGQKSFGTSITVTFLGVISLLSTISTAKDEKIRLRLWANLGAGGVQTSLAGAQATFAALRALGTGAALQKSLAGALASDAAEAVGVFGCIFGVVSGTISILEARETGDDNEFWLGVASAAGGTLALAGWLCMVPGLQVAGAVVGIAGAAVGAYQVIKDKLRTGTERVFSTRMAQFRASNNVAPFEHDVPEFAAAISDLADFALNTAKFFTLPNNPDNQAKIAKIGFVSDEIKLIFGT
jgi:hypothetical protein